MRNGYSTSLRGNKTITKKNPTNKQTNTKLWLKGPASMLSHGKPLYWGPEEVSKNLNLDMLIQWKDDWKELFFNHESSNKSLLTAYVSKNNVCFEQDLNVLNFKFFSNFASQSNSRNIFALYHVSGTMSSMSVIPVKLSDTILNI